MTVTGHDYVAAHLHAVTIPGAYYGQCASRCFPENWPHCTDCSGSTSAALRYVGLGENGCEGSFAQARRCYAAGTEMSVDEAFHTAGAWVFEGINNGRGGIPGQDPGHIGTSVGDGLHSIEARGHWAGIGVFRIDSLVWSGAGMPPGVAKVTGAPPGVTIPPLAVQEDDTMTTIALPGHVGATPSGRYATARPVKAFNFVLLENGARLAGDIATADNTGRHWWAPPPSAHVPGWQILDIADLRPLGRQSIAVLFGFPNGEAGTYEAGIIG